MKNISVEQKQRFNFYLGFETGGFFLRESADVLVWYNWASLASLPSDTAEPIPGIVGTASVNGPAGKAS